MLILGFECRDCLDLRAFVRQLVADGRTDGRSAVCQRRYIGIDHTGNVTFTRIRSKHQSM